MADIFLSYCWHDERVADNIDNYFKKLGIKFKRDKRDISKWKSIKEFMKQIRKSNYAILIISENYLKSKNCMYEVLELMKEEKYKERLITVVLKDSEIYEDKKRIEYVSYWEKKYKELNEAISNIENIESVNKSINDLKVIREIYTNINEFLDLISDLYNPNLDDVCEEILNKLTLEGIVDKDLPNVKVKVEDILNDLNFMNELLDDYEEEKLNKLENEIDDVEEETFDYEECNKQYEIILENISKKIDTSEFDAYYILSKTKTVAYRTNTMQWWTEGGKSYSDKLEKSGIFSKNDIKVIIKPFNHIDRYTKSIAIPVEIVDEIFQQNIIPYNEYFLNMIKDNEKYVIGDLIWNLPKGMY